MLGLLRIKRQERLAAVLFLMVILAFQYLIISKFWCLFANYNADSFDIFMRNFHMSGFDPITYDVVTHWHEGYDILRHPLLALMMYPLYILNQLLWTITGANCVQLAVALPLIFCGFYSVLFVHRTMTEVVGIAPACATLLSLLFMGFAYVLISMIVPDHFCLSMFCLTLTCYLSGRKMKCNQCFGVTQATLLFLLTAGITLSNGAIVLGMITLTNGIGILRQQRLMASLVTALVAIVALVMIQRTLTPGKYAHQNMVEQQFSWTRQNVDKAEILQENFFGESLQLHRKHILGDVLRNRPVIVRYTWPAQNYVTIIIQLMLLMGIVTGFRQRFVWILVGVLAFNLLLHIGMAFAIDEVYIMASHWAFTLPLAMAYLFTLDNKWAKALLAIVVVALTIYIFLYHGYLLHRYLTWPLAK